MTTVLQAQVSEIRDRVTRIETRQLQMMEHLQMETHVRKPVWLADEGAISIPNMGCAIKDILAAIPADWCGIDILVMFKGGVLTILRSVS